MVTLQESRHRHRGHDPPGHRYGRRLKVWPTWPSGRPYIATIKEEYELSVELLSTVERPQNGSRSGLAGSLEKRRPLLFCPGISPCCRNSRGLPCAIPRVCWKCHAFCVMSYHHGTPCRLDPGIAQSHPSRTRILCLCKALACAAYYV